MKHYLLIGSPGTGKTTWARKQAIHFKKEHERFFADMAYIYKIAGLESPAAKVTGTIPFRAPHHTVSRAGMFGTVQNGWKWRPRECSLAHGGILMLDELPKFRKEILQEILSVVKDRSIMYHGTKHHFIVPCEFQLIATMNPCPCGFRGFNTAPDRCTCTEEQVKRYNNRVSEFLDFCEILHFDGKKVTDKNGKDI